MASVPGASGNSSASASKSGTTTPLSTHSHRKGCDSVQRSATRRRTAHSIAKDAEEGEAARREGKSLAAVDALAIKSGIKGYSLFLSPSPEDKLRYPNRGYFSKIGPAALPYDTMHLVLSNVTQLLWALFSCEFGVMGTTPEPYILPKTTVTAIGREIEAGRATVPSTQARSIRDINVHYRSYKASDWMFFLLSVGEVVLGNRLPEEIFVAFMYLCKAARLMFRPSGLSKVELTTVESHIKKICRASTSTSTLGVLSASRYAAMCLSPC